MGVLSLDITRSYVRGGCTGKPGGKKGGTNAGEDFSESQENAL